MPTTYKPRSKSELDKETRKHLIGLLQREKDDLNSDELAFLKARRVYLTAEQMKHYGIKLDAAMKSQAPDEGPGADEESEEDEVNVATDEEDESNEEGEDMPDEDEDEAPASGGEFADLDPATGKPFKKGKKK